VELVSNVNQLPQILTRAIRAAVGRRGVAVVVIPGDVALKPLDIPTPLWVVPARPIVRPNDDQIANLAKFLNAEGRVTLLCGAGCAGAHDEVVTLARKLKAPIVHTLRGKEHIEYDNPNDVGMTGLVGFASGYKAMKNCESLLILGADFPYRQFFPDDADIVQVDARPEALGNRCPLYLGLIGEIKPTLDALLPQVIDKADGTHLEECLADYAHARRDLDSLAELDSSTKHVHPQAVSRIVSEVAAEDAIFTCDVGTPIAWAARYLKLNGRRRLIGSFNHGSMANAMMHAIGAQVSFPNRQVISFSGDGGFSMMMGELLSIVQLKLPVKIVLLNNGTLGFVELEMKASGFLDFGCDLTNPNFAVLAQSVGIKAIRVSDPKELRTAATEILNHPGPAMLEVMTPRQELVMPPTTTIDQAKHFGLFMMRAVLDGRATQIVDLAKVNLQR
jgi:pyruvate dehydrogenase (quinone)